ncbi:aggrecan core protein-like isoform X12 [Oncorhynchus tshawytscha]|uniref:aggrecan core protein-like isoform X12 n=1 Tax=Oncorhynchus tshawytscha TaxID=74940 RepID=UPI001C3DC0D0|nr:aggrecan core protein-like isoform X12 [Oncorhynchus tshawytscha]
MKEDREVERQTKLEEAVLETDIPTLSLEADGEIEMQEADLKTDGTSQSQEVEGEIELDDAVAIPSQSQEVEGESELDEAIVIPSQSQEEAKGESELNQVDLKTSTSTLTLEVEGASELNQVDLKTSTSTLTLEVEGESELNQVDLKTSTSTLTLEVEGESELNQVDLKTSTSTLTLEVEGESVMQESDDVETAGPSQSQETQRVAKAAVVTFTTMTRKAAASQTSLTLSRGKRSYPDLHTFVQDMKDGHWNLLSENMRARLFKTKGEPKSHPEQDSLPTKRLRETRISQDAECEVPSTSPPKEALTTTLAPAPQESQYRKRPLIVRVLRAISRAVSKPFREAFGKKN